MTLSDINALLLNEVWATNEHVDLGGGKACLINHAFQFIVATNCLPYRPDYRTFSSIDLQALRQHINKKLGHGKLGESYDMAHHYMNGVLEKLVPEANWLDFKRELARKSGGYRRPVDMHMLLEKHGGHYSLREAKFGPTVVQELSTPEQRVAAFLARLTPEKRAYYGK